MKLTQLQFKVLLFMGMLFFSAFVIAVDLNIGHYIRLPVLFVLPVMIVSWYYGFAAGLLFAAGLPIVRLILLLQSNPPWSAEI